MTRRQLTTILNHAGGVGWGVWDMGAIRSTHVPSRQVYRCGRVAECGRAECGRAECLSALACLQVAQCGVLGCSHTQPPMWVMDAGAPITMMR